jgi:hypothetical protein
MPFWRKIVADLEIGTGITTDKRVLQHCQELHLDRPFQDLDWLVNISNLTSLHVNRLIKKQDTTQIIKLLQKLPQLQQLYITKDRENEISSVNILKTAIATLKKLQVFSSQMTSVWDCWFDSSPDPTLTLSPIVPINGLQVLITCKLYVLIHLSDLQIAGVPFSDIEQLPNLRHLTTNISEDVPLEKVQWLLEYPKFLEKCVLNLNSTTPISIPPKIVTNLTELKLIYCRTASFYLIADRLLFCAIGTSIIASKLTI